MGPLFVTGRLFGPRTKIYIEYNEKFVIFLINNDYLGCFRGALLMIFFGRLRTYERGGVSPFPRRSKGNFSKALSLCKYFCHFFQKIFLSEPKIFDIQGRSWISAVKRIEISFYPTLIPSNSRQIKISSKNA